MGRLSGFFRRSPLLHVAIDRGGGPPVVLLHGIASSSVTFEHVVPLVEGRHRAIAIDLLGFGGSPSPEHATYTVEEHVAALARTIRSLKLREPVVLVGHSMGALIAARYASRSGGWGAPRVARVVLVSPPVYLDPAAIGSG